MEKPGDYAFDEGRHNLYLWLPGSTGPDCVPIQRGTTEVLQALGRDDRVWAWDGNEEAPTVTPSILTIGQWHGHLKSGRLISC